MRPYCFYFNYDLKRLSPQIEKTNKKLNIISEDFIKFNYLMFDKCFLYDTQAANHCKYATLNFPFKILKGNCLLFNKLIFDTGFESKNNKVIKLMIHNLENRFKTENPNDKSFKEYFNCNENVFKNFIFEKMDAGMNLDNYGIIWNLDHIIPINSVKENNQINKNVWNYTNLAPLSIEENIKKGSKIISQNNVSIKFVQLTNNTELYIN